jgi:glutaredoxin
MKRAALATLLLLSAAAAQAQFKDVGPDGRVTSTDRPPPAAEGRATPVRPSSAGTAAAPLPADLREPASRFSVTLYTAPECSPCDSGRQLLRHRGIPFLERTAGAGDRDAWIKIVGSADAPALAIGRQWLRGYSPEQWHSYLDTAGYPRESKLPPGYVPPPAAPLVERAAPAPAAPPTPATPAEVPQAPESPGGIRF